jgi:hypothetical protein
MDGWLVLEDTLAKQRVSYTLGMKDSVLQD